ncbi:hypothetical protein AGR8A_pTi20183 [Agrobacterium fabrum str. J-07]|nr:hypothetical protein AGR8A_pTi20183 [Agrobacterium fabrum str. J-07]
MKKYNAMFLNSYFYFLTKMKNHFKKIY